jgi:hypothetical protein
MAGVAWLPLPQACRRTWGGNSVSSLAAAGFAVEAKVPALVVRARCLRHPPDLERAQGVLDGVQRGPVGPPGPPWVSSSAPDLRPALPGDIEPDIHRGFTQNLGRL